MRSLQPARTLVSSRQRVGHWSGVRWLPRLSVRDCSCSTPNDKPPKHKSLNPTTSDPPIPTADHRTLGTALDLFSTSIYSPGSPLFHPDGAHIFQKLQAFLRAQYATFGFREVITPTIYKQSLWEKSGHWDNYKDDMFEVTGRGASGAAKTEKAAEIGEDEKYGLKPMNCPGHCLLFKSQSRSYRDLPIRYADFSPLHRNEISGALSGLTRVRRFHQDDGHVFCRPAQVREEIEKTLQFVGLVYETFGLGPYKLVLSTRPKEQFLGKVEEWDRAETQLKEALNKSGREWEINEGDGAFYGPKIDIILKDSDGKEHQTATIQLDFQLPQRFGLTYTAPAPEFEAKGETTTDSAALANTGEVTPVIIHRAILGSLERFMALLIEHYKGHWPFWLSPRQVIVLPLTQNEVAYANDIAAKLNHIDGPSTALGRPRPLGLPYYHVDVDKNSQTIGKKVSRAKTKHYNLICVVGKTECASGKMVVEIVNPAQREYAAKIFSEDCRSKKGPRYELDVEQLQGFMADLSRRYL